MKVFKFGGASVKDAAGVRNVAKVLSHFPDEDLLIVVSAMGKTTNALEEVVWAFSEGKEVHDKVEALRRSHSAVLAEVAPNDVAAGAELVLWFDRLNTLLAQGPTGMIDGDYDQIVSQGEIWSTLIVSAYLNSCGLENKWMDARKVVRTDARFRDARVQWDALEDTCATYIPSFERSPMRLVTQGFIGSTEDGLTTTLGREGSDFSAAIFAYAMDLLHGRARRWRPRD